MLTVIGALAIALAAFTMLGAAILVRHPSVPTLLKAEGFVTALAVLITSVLALGVVMIANEAEQSSLTHLASAATIIIGATILPVLIFANLPQHWRNQLDNAPVSQLPHRKDRQTGPIRKNASTNRRAA